MAQGAEAADRESLTPRQALKDLGWFWGLFTSAVGAPSVLSIVQAVFEHRLIDAFQWIVDGYNQLVGKLAAFVEPTFATLIAWINVRLDWSLVLHPHWRPMFAVALILILGIARAQWRQNAPIASVLFGVPLALGALLGCIAAGLIPLTGAWWAQGAAGALPPTALVVFLGLAMAADSFAHAAPFTALQTLRDTLVMAGLLGAAAFAAAAGVSFIPGLRSGAGVIVIGLAVMALGVNFVVAGLTQRETALTRCGLTFLGGFVAAALILIADAIVKALS